MAVDPLVLLGALSGGAPPVPAPPVGGPAGGLPDALGLRNLMGGQVDTSEVVMARLRPAIRLVHELADYVATTPDIAPLVQAYVKLVLGRAPGKQPGGMRAGAGLLVPAPVPGPAMGGPGPSPTPVPLGLP
jgi:hypothetical protein